MAINQNIISVSPGNDKMGRIPSVSLPAIVTCRKDAPCFKLCYAHDLENRRKNVKNAYIRNYNILLNNPASYWLQLRAAASITRFFRYHVSGDILNPEYFTEMIKTAEMFPDTRFMCFTKKYNIVNNYIAKNGNLPENLKILFSEWGEGWEVPNPYNLPTAKVIFKNEPIPENVKICGNNCESCACRGVGCWELKSGESIGLFEH